MKKFKEILFFQLVLSLMITGSANAQLRSFGNFIASGPEDAQKMFEAYLSPYLNGFGASMTGGWYNTASAHKPLGFDITITANVAIVPKTYRTYDVDALELNGLVRAPGTDQYAPTVAGEDVEGALMQYNIEGFQQDAFELPPGTNFPYVPSPMIQAGIGIYKGTEIMGRFMPKIGYRDKGKFGFWGIGLKHDIKQWIPGLKDLPVLNISIMGGYTKLNSFVALNITPGTLNLGDFYDGDPEIWDNQKMDLSSSSYTINLLVSADLPVVCFYAGFGFATTKTTLALKGNYPMIQEIDVATAQPVVEPVLDPLKFEAKNQDGGFTKPRLNGGIRLKFGVFTMHFDYTRANFNVVTAGMGISFR
jgi:hypothetical protein